MRKRRRREETEDKEDREEGRGRGEMTGVMFHTQVGTLYYL